MSALQTNWDARAALNFMCGGSGAGLLVATALVRPPQAGWAIGVALALIGCGLTAVWWELGKPWRALHVFFNPFTSWMARESLAAVALFGLGIAALFQPALVFAAAAAAAVFVFCQARMLQGAKGIPAWRARETLPLLLATSLAEGAGLCLLFASDELALALFVTAVLARALVWSGYSAAVRSPALAAAGRIVLQFGSGAALALLLAGALLPQALPLAGLIAAAAGWYLKFALVTRASLKQGFALPRLPVRGAR
jgi:phenylacetyl-CoA:acceptor oxidoreductase subunit 2